LHWPRRLSDFPGLEGDVEDETLDGLVMLTIFDAQQSRSMERRGIPMCHVGFWDTMPHATVVDRCGVLIDAVTLLAARGARRLAFIDGQAESLLARARDRSSAVDGHVRDLLAACEGIPSSTGLGTVVATAQQLCARCKAQRPEVLATQSDYRPLFVVSTNRQLPLAFALPVIRIELDLDELADVSVAKFRKRLLNPAAYGGIEYVQPRVCESDGDVSGKQAC
jgi:hypothetical protein